MKHILRQIRRTRLALRVRKRPIILLSLISSALGGFADNMWLDSRDFGTVGDGVADDTAALQQALNALTNNARGLTTLRVPKGTYRLTQTLYMPVGKSTGVTFPD